MKKDNPIVIFGYGSLISETSLRDTVPNAKNIRPAYIRGFRRLFNKTDHEGWTSVCTNEAGENIQGIPYCAVNIAPDKMNSKVNGVIFEVDYAELHELRQREMGYDLVETEVFDFIDGQPLGKCKVFCAQNCDGSYEQGNLAQEYYLGLCLEAAKDNGPDFYEQFLATTYINDIKLCEMPRFAKNSEPILSAVLRWGRA